MRRPLVPGGLGDARFRGRPASGLTREAEAAVGGRVLSPLVGPRGAITGVVADSD